MRNSIKRIMPLSFPWQTQDPFLFCVFHKDDYPEGNDQLGPNASLSGRNLGNDFTVKDGWRMYHGTKVPGFPAHPHRGFETVTIVQEGIIDHSDSLGAAGRFGDGDVQWMTAGKGVQHCEMFPLLRKEERNPMDFFQIWLNLPKKDKLTEPYFAMLWAKEIPVVREQDKTGKNISLRLIAGSYKEKMPPAPAPNSWAHDPEHEVRIWTINMEAGAKFTIPAARGKVTRSLYFFEGNKIQIEDQQISINKVIELDGKMETIIENGDQDNRLLLLEGQPIEEPVAQYGPFVMNSQREIMQAMEDYRRTEFGGWPWPTLDNVHGSKKGKFALYPDGTEVTP